MLTTVIAWTIAIVLFSFLGYLNAQFVVFVDWCFNTGNVLDWYYIKVQELSKTHPKLAKPLGLCPVCMGFWIGLFIFTMFGISMGVSALLFFPFIAVSTYRTLKLFKVEGIA